jgi:YkoY family integral membrane protein
MLTTLLIILNIVLLEIILSIDNAAVLATMVKTLPENQQKKALTWGIIGAYLFRGLALLFASLLISITWLKLVGGLYLIFISIKSLLKKSEDSDLKVTPVGFWRTVISIEIMDLVFSIDNVLAAVSFTDSLSIIMLGVGIGILAIRFATTKFISIINNNPIVEKIAYYVIAGLGLKLALSYFLPVLNLESIDLVFSLLTLIAFIAPIIFKKMK